jgi:hypothetical protein
MEEFEISLDDHDDIPFGILSVKDCDPSTTFFIRGKGSDGIKIRIFKTENLQERQEWLNFLYEITHRECQRESINSSQMSKGDYIERWREYAQKGFFAPGQYIPSTSTRADELAHLVSSIEKITKEDVYYTVMKAISVPVMVMPRGLPLRELLLEILKAPRPHDMCNWTETAENVLSPIKDFRGKLGEAIKLCEDEELKKSLNKLDEYYHAFCQTKGAQPRPALLRSGIEKIGSRIIPKEVVDVISDPNNSTQEGIHRVVRVGDVYLKVNPSAPAYEMAVGELCELIWQQGTAITIIVKIELANASYVCQAADAVEGLLLRDFMKELPDLVKFLDEENLTTQYLTGTLYRPLDGKLDNIIM